jgi:hypothetical protein
MGSVCLGDLRLLFDFLLNSILPYSRGPNRSGIDLLNFHFLARAAIGLKTAVRLSPSIHKFGDEFIQTSAELPSV